MHEGFCPHGRWQALRAMRCHQSSSLRYSPSAFIHFHASVLDIAGFRWVRPLAAYGTGQAGSVRSAICRGAGNCERIPSRCIDHGPSGHCVKQMPQQALFAGHSTQSIRSITRRPVFIVVMDSATGAACSLLPRWRVSTAFTCGVPLSFVKATPCSSSHDLQVSVLPHPSGRRA